jgi:hypothetical protein
LNVRFAPKAAIREIDFLQCEGRRFRPALGLTCCFQQDAHGIADIGVIIHDKDFTLVAHAISRLPDTYDAEVKGRFEAKLGKTAKVKVHPSNSRKYT